MFGIKSIVSQTAPIFRAKQRIKTLKSKGKISGGGRIAHLRGRSSASPVTRGTGTERKSVNMKNVMEKSAQFESQVASSQQEMSQELFDPQEWESLLNSFEDGSQSAAASTHVNSGEIELSSDDLWERLSSTRWLREQVSDRESTITQRPMD